MASSRPRPNIKVSVECPRCGFEQRETTATRSTDCRNCGHHFEIKVRPAIAAPRRASAPAPGSEVKVGSRDVKCFECDASHAVPTTAKTTLCPRCGSYVDLQDYDIAARSNRNIRTRGRLVVRARGDLNCARAVCGSALVEGRVRGSLHCGGKAVLRGRGVFAGDIEAVHLVIERDAEVEFARAVRAVRVEIMGKTMGNIVCGGQVVILSQGTLLGNLHARALDVEHGAELAGQLEIRPDIETVPAPASADAPDPAAPAATA